MTQTIKYWAYVEDNGHLSTIKQLKARNHVAQEGCIEIDEATFNAIRSSTDKQFYVENGHILSKPRTVIYREARRLEYPAVEDQIGALMKAADGDDSELQTLLQAIRDVKEKYPKE